MARGVLRRVDEAEVASIEVKTELRRNYGPCSAGRERPRIRVRRLRWIAMQGFGMSGNPWRLHVDGVFFLMLLVLGLMVGFLGYLALLGIARAA
jgi:hypothetical protein